MQVVPQRRTRSGSPSAYLLNRTRALPLHLSTFLIASLAGLLCTLVFSGCATNSITPYVRLPSKSHVEKLPFEVGLYLTDSFKSYVFLTSVGTAPYEMTIHVGKSSVDLWTKGLANSFERVTVVSEHDEPLPLGIVFLRPAIDNVHHGSLDNLSYRSSEFKAGVILTYDVEVLASSKDVLETLSGKGGGIAGDNPISTVAALFTMGMSGYVTENSDYASMYRRAFAKAQRSAFEDVMEQLDQHRHLFETE